MHRYFCLLGGFTENQGMWKNLFINVMYEMKVIHIAKIQVKRLYNNYIIMKIFP